MRTTQKERTNKMPCLKIRLNDDDMKKVAKMAKEKGVSCSTMLAFILDKGDKHRETA